MANPFRVIVVVLCCLTVGCLAGDNDGVTDEAVEAFQKWFHSAGGRSRGVELARFPGEFGGVGVRTTGPVSDGDQVLSIPFDLVMYVRVRLRSVGHTVICCGNMVCMYLCSWRETIVGSVSERRLSQIYSRLKSEDDMFALFLVRERALAADSKWAPYIRVLPRHLPLPLFYSNTELKALQVGLLRVWRICHRPRNRVCTPRCVGVVGWAGRTGDELCPRHEGTECGTL